MEIRTFVLLTAITLSVCGISFGQEGGEGHQPVRLTLLHLNDTHSNFLPGMLSITFAADSSGWRVPVGSVARVVTLVDSIRGADGNVLFLHAGDMVQGSLFYTLFGGEADAAVYNAMGLDAMTLGNHEFDRGSEGLLVLLEDAEFPVICANLDVRGDSLLAGLIQPWMLFDIDGEQVAVIGLIVDELANVSSPSSETLVLQIVETAQAVIDQLESMGINKVVLLTHIGYTDDLALASQLTGVDIIVGGHSHTLLGDLSGLGISTEGSYPTVVDGLDGTPVLVVTAGTRCAVLGRLAVDFDGEGRVVSFEGEPLFVTGGEYQDSDRNPVEGEDLAWLEMLIMQEPLLVEAEENPEIKELVGTYEAELAAFAYEVVGSASTDLHHQRVPGGELPDGSMIAPVMCDAFLWKTEQVGLEPDIVILNAGGARIPVPAGDITVGTVYTLMPFGNTLAVLDMTGAQVKAVLEDAISNIFDDGNSDGSFPYTAGMRYSADPGMPEGERVTSAEVLGPDGWKPLNPEDMYRVVTVAFLAGGGDGYATFEEVESLDTGFIDAEVFMEYMAQAGPLGSLEPWVSFIQGD